MATVELAPCSIETMVATRGAGLERELFLRHAGR
jgi:hypothetical protein